MFRRLENTAKQEVDQNCSKFHPLTEIISVKNCVHVLPLFLFFITMEEGKFNGEKPSFSMAK